MVLRALPILVLVAACNQSLFDQYSGDGGGDDDGSGTASTCPTPCVADAGGDFGASGKNWRYVEDTRNRAWVAMTPSGDTAVGADDSKNTITACSAHGDAPACAALPGALLVSSSGSASMADPAAEWTSTTNQVVKLELSAFVASGEAAQNVLLYRNSREDSLVATIAAMPGTAASASVTVDAFAGDRFLVAVAPSGAGAMDVGVQLFASGTGASFPQTCELGLGFDGASGTSIANACGSKVTSMDANTASTSAITLGPPPYVQLGQAAMFVENKYLIGADVLDRKSDTTTQLWVQHLAVVADSGAWVFSDYDLDFGGGVGIVVYDNQSGTLTLQAGTCTDPTPDFAEISTSYPNDHAWHFVRVVHTNGKFNLCLDGTMVASMPLAAGALKTTYPPYMAQNVVWTPSGAFFDGSLDDVRVFSTALPCGN